MKIALLSCTKNKQTYDCPAAEMYSVSSLFSLSYEYVKPLADKILILSAKYGVLEETDKISPYNLTLNDFSKKDKMEWGKKVLEQLSNKCNLDKDDFIILTGKNYYDSIITGIKHYIIPLNNLSFGQRLSYLSKINSSNKPIKQEITDIKAKPIDLW